MTQRIDMANFIQAKSDQLNADDLLGAPRTVTVTRVIGCGGDQPVAIHYEGDDGKPFKPCKTIRRVLMGVWGRYADEYVGRSMTLVRDPEVTFGGLKTGGIRITHMSHIDEVQTIVVMKTKGKKAGIKILPLKVEAVQPQAAKQTPEQWVDGYIAGLMSCADMDALASARTKAGKALSRLADGHPSLYERADAAFMEREVVLSGEGRADEQHGDQHDGTDEAPAYADMVNSILARIARSETVIDANGVRDDWMRHAPALPDEENEKIEAALNAKLGELKGVV